MVQKCCVPNCTSTKAVPSHMFPKDVERRKQWFASLNITPITEESKIKGLRVCHKHFSEEDYSSSGNRRVLVHAAIPFVNLPQFEMERVSDNDVKQEIKEETASPQKDNVILQNEVTNDEMLMKHETLLQEQQNILQEQQNILQQHKEELQNIKAVLNMPQTSSSTRPDLQEITRQNQLTPKARKLCRRIVTMKKDRRRLKRLNKKLMTKPTNLCLNTKKGNIDKTAQIRQQVIDMIIRNNDVAPQLR